jgi:hypothetical protein
MVTEPPSPPEPMPPSWRAASKATTMTAISNAAGLGIPANGQVERQWTGVDNDAFSKGYSSRLGRARH